jgi:FHA domain
VKALLPQEVSRAISTRGQATFAAEYTDTLLLLVSVEEGSEVLASLSSTASEGQAQAPGRRLDYHTEALDKQTVDHLLAAAKRTQAERAALIRQTLGRGRHFVQPLRKRASADRISLDRVSVGRAMNSDIVLRDGSVSKMHAWFEQREDREFSIADAGSTNHTAVNGQKLTPRKLRPLCDGDIIELGSVTALICSAETLWSAVHTDGA